LEFAPALDQLPAYGFELLTRRSEELPQRLQVVGRLVKGIPELFEVVLAVVEGVSDALPRGDKTKTGTA
jgi:hypothetical protein